MSLVITRYIVGFMFRSRSRTTRFAVAAVSTMIAALVAWEWSNPTKLLAAVAGGDIRSVYAVAGGAEFIFGAYPDEDRLMALKREGVTSIVSLQHPGVVIEREGISSERASTKRLGLNFIQAPMLPWVSDNDDAVAKLQQLARTAKGKYYVHCGLGRDRVNVAKRIIEAEGKRVSVSSDIKSATTFYDRRDKFERGSAAHFDHEKWLVPYLNKFEMFGYILFGQSGPVVSLLDPANKEQLLWLQEMRITLAKYKIKLVEMPLVPNDAAAAERIAKVVRGMKAPVTVMAPNTPDEDGKPTKDSGTALTFIKAYGKLYPDTYSAHQSWRLNKTVHNAGGDSLAGSIAR